MQTSKRFPLLGFPIAALALFIVNTTFSARAQTRTRVALMDFVCEDNSYRSMNAAADLSVRLQAEIGASAGVEWVDRNELHRAEEELQLAGFGLLDRAESLRAGRWAHADWAVFGRIGTNSPTGRTVGLEVVDLSRADILAQDEVKLSRLTNGPLLAGSLEATQLTVGLKRLLSEARGKLESMGARPALALMGCSAGQFAVLVPDFEAAFRAALKASATNSSRPYHLLQLQRAGEALDEADLILSGLVESDPNAWEKLARWYVWCTYEMLPGPPMGLRTNGLLSPRSFLITLKVWDARGEPRKLSLLVPNGSSAELAGRVTAALMPMLSMPTTNVVEHSSKQIADSLIQEVITNLWLIRSGSLETAEGRSHWLDAVQKLETACFFDSGNLPGRELLLRLRWGWQARYAARNLFSFARRRSDAWKKFAEGFQFRSELPAIVATDGVETNNIAGQYVKSAWDIYQMFISSPPDNGMPPDAGPEQRAAWKKQFGTELYRRLLKAPTNSPLPVSPWGLFYGVLDMNGGPSSIADPMERERVFDFLWPRILEKQKTAPSQFDGAFLPALKNHFRELGRPGAEGALLSQLPVSPGTEGIRKVKLPVISEVVDQEDAEVLAVRVLNTPLPSKELGPPAFRTACPPDVKRLQMLCCAGGTLWLGLETERVGRLTRDNNTERQLGDLKTTDLRLWRLDLVNRKLERVSGWIATNLVTAMVSEKDQLCLGLDEAGVALWRPAQPPEWDHFDVAPGLGNVTPISLAIGSGGIFCVGGDSNFSLLPNGSNRWETVPLNVNRRFNLPYTGNLRRLAAGSGRVLLYNADLLLGDLAADDWQRVDVRTNAPSGQGPLTGVRAMLADRQGVFWVATRDALHRIEPAGHSPARVSSQWITLETNSRANQRAREDARLPLEVRGQLRRLLKANSDKTSQIAEAMDLRARVANGRQQNPLLPNPFVAGSRLPGPPAQLTTQGEFLWVLAGDSTTGRANLLLYHLPSRRWTGCINTSADVSIVSFNDELLLVRCNFGFCELFRLKAEQVIWPRDQWLPEEVSTEDREELLKALPAHQQAVVHFMANENEKTVQLISSEPGEPSAESLFMLAMARDSQGPNDPAERARHTRELMEQHPNSVFTKYLQGGGTVGTNRPGTVRRSSSPPKAAPLFQSTTNTSDGREITP